MLHLVELVGLGGDAFGLVVLDLGEPGVAKLLAPLADAGLEVVVDAGRDEELLGGDAELLLPGEDHVLAQGGAVCLGAVLLGRAVADVAVDDDEGRPVVGVLERLERLGQGLGVVGVHDLDDVPVVGPEPGGGVLGEGDRGRAVDGDPVRVVDPAEVGELEVAGEAGGLGGDAFHHVAVAAEGVDVVVEEVEAGLVVVGPKPLAGRGHADAGGHALAERPGGGLDAAGPAVFGVARALAVELAELLEVVQGQRGLGEVFVLGADRLHAGQVDHRVEEHRGVADREDEAVAVRPDRVGRVEPEELLPERVGDRGHRHRGARVARVGRLDSVHGQGLDRADATQVEVVLGGHGRKLPSHQKSGAEEALPDCERQPSWVSPIQSVDRHSSRIPFAFRPTSGDVPP